MPIERRPRDRPRARRRGRRRHPGRVARAAHRRLSARRPRAVARVRRRAAGRARALRARDRDARVRVRARPRRGPRREPLQRGGARARGPGLGLRARRRSCRSTTSSTRRARSRAARRASTTTLGGVPFGDLVFDLDFGTVGARGLRGRLVARRPDAPALVRRRRARRQPQRLAVSARHRRDAARDDCDARRRQPGDASPTSNLVGANDGLVFDGGGFVAQNGRLVLAAPRFREGVEAVTVDLDRTRRLRTENTTWRDDQEAFAALAPKVTRVRVDAPTRGARAARRSRRRANKSFFLPAAGAPRDRARRVLRRAARRARARPRRLLREDRRVQDDRRRALGRARQPARARHRAPLDRAALGRLPDAERASQGARDPARVLHADALLVARDARRGRAGRARPRRAARGRLDRRRVRARARGRREDAAARRDAHADGAPERAGARARRAHVDVGQRRAAGSSCRRAT